MKSSHTFFVDAHVHFYDCYDSTRFLDSIQKNVIAAAAKAGLDSGFSAVLLLSERQSENWFQLLVDSANSPSGLLKNTSWQLQYNEQDFSIHAKNEQQPSIYIIPGRQVVTRESLEVLLLGTRDMFDDGISIDTLLKNVRDKPILRVLPWGVGKWLGKRGSIITRVLGNVNSKSLFVGDIAGRPALWASPAQFSLAQQKGIRVLPGTDPLPIPEATGMACTYGFSFTGKEPGKSPGQQIISAILDPQMMIRPYGNREKLFTFLRRQILLRIKKC